MANNRKSPFDFGFPKLFHDANEQKAKLDECLSKSLSSYSSEELRVLLVLSAIYNDCHLSFQHLNKLLDIQVAEFHEVELSFSCSIEPNNCSRKTLFFGIESARIILLLKKQKSSTVAVQESTSTLFKTFGFGDEFERSVVLEGHIKFAESLWLMSNVPSFLIHHTKSPKDFSHGLSLKSYASLFEYHPKSLGSDWPSSFPALKGNYMHETAFSVKGFKANVLKKFKEADNARRNSDRKSKMAQSLIQIQFNLNSDAADSCGQIIRDWLVFELIGEQQATIQVSTLRGYFASTFDVMLKSCPEKSLIEFLKVANQTKLKEYADNIKTSFPDNRSKDKRCAAFNRFFRYLSKEYGIAEIKIHESSPTVVSTQSVEILSIREYNAVLELIESTHSLDTFSKRTYQVLLILYFRFGLRPFEPYRIRLKDVNLECAEIHITSNQFGKVKTKTGNKKLPLFLLSDDERQLLVSHLKNQKSGHDSSENQPLILPSFNRNAAKSLCDSLFMSLLRKITDKQNLSTKSLRKSFANYMTMQLLIPTDATWIRKQLGFSDAYYAEQKQLNEYFWGADNQNGNHQDKLLLLAKMMGHKSSTTTLKSYIHIQDFLLFLETSTHYTSQHKPAQIRKNFHKLNNSESKSRFYVYCTKYHSCELIAFLYQRYLKPDPSNNEPDGKNQNNKTKPPKLENVSRDLVNFDEWRKVMIKFINSDEKSVEAVTNEISNQQGFSPNSIKATIEGIKSDIEYFYEREIDIEELKSKVQDILLVKLKNKSVILLPSPKYFRKVLLRVNESSPATVSTLLDAWRSHYTNGILLSKENKQDIISHLKEACKQEIENLEASEQEKDEEKLSFDDVFECEPPVNILRLVKTKLTRKTTTAPLIEFMFYLSFLNR